MIPLPTPEAALALAGAANETLQRLASLTGASLVLRGLDLVIQGRPPQVERAASLISLLQPLWSCGEAVAPVDLQTALNALDTGRDRE
ncbi:MAG: phosphate starvation-inducible protein PhoH, partial [Synechococcaceae cyanobacterium]|nr:phosphate starvation-inducible protein PhoH [Synechococcaceae cyanobacterium]